MKYGDVLGGTYQIIGQIGAGGGGVVYQGKHLRLNTDIVVKQLREEVRGKIDSHGEVDVLKNLKHRYLPRIYDFIENEEGVFTVMDYIPGEPLNQVIHNERRIPQKRALKWAKQLGEVLAYLHSQATPIVHSDIKPANIIITPDDDVCLIDFNISMALDSHYSDSRGISAGYAAPEQYGAVEPKHKYRDAVETEYVYTSDEDDTAITAIIEDETETGVTRIISDGEKETELLPENRGIRPRKTAGRADHASSGSKLKGYVDTRSDIYSLGCVFYHMTTGIVPAKRPDMIIPIWDTKASISEGFAVVIEKMMQFEPENRYRNGAEFYKVIQEIYKLDKRYIVQRRKENLLLALTLTSFIVGAGFLAAGLSQQKLDKENAMFATAEGLYTAGDYESSLAVCDELLLSKTEVEEWIKTHINLFNSRQREADVYYLMANSFFELNDYTDAKTHIEKAIELNDKNPLYFRDYGMILAKTGDLSKAEQVLEQAKALGLGGDSIYILQAEIKESEGKHEEALGMYINVANQTEDPALRKRAWLSAVGLLQDSNQLDDSIEILESALSQTNSEAAITIAEKLAAAYEKKGATSGDEEEQQKYWKRSLALYENLLEKGYVTRQMYENVVILCEETGDFSRAEQILTDMLQSYPDDYRIYKRLSFLEADMQQTTAVEERDYAAMKAYYDEAIRLYSISGEDDQEMTILSNLISELEEYGWFEEKNEWLDF